MKPRHFFVQDPAEKGFFYSFIEKGKALMNLYKVAKLVQPTA